MPRPCRALTPLPCQQVELSAPQPDPLVPIHFISSYQAQTMGRRLGWLLLKQQGL